MIVDLTGFLDAGETSKSIDGQITETNMDFIDDEIEIVNPIKFNGAFYKVSDYFALDLKINFKIKTECDRCLKPLEEEVNTQLFGKLVDNHYEREEDDDEEFDELFILDKNRINLKPYILEQVVASIPMKNLCDEECKGLCQTCGVDLNVETCNCENNIIDPRLEKLKELFPENKEV